MRTDPAAAARTLLACLALACASGALAGEALRDRATGAEFAQRVAFSHAGREYDLRVTGLAVRRVAIFKVYAMAHYVDAVSGADGEALLDLVLSDRVAKQVTMHFVRDISGGRIADSLVESIERNASPETLRLAAPAVEQFAATVRHDVRKGERFTVRWLPGGTTVCLFNDKQVLVIHNGAFGRALWSMWFGDRPVVDRASLLGASRG